jgi:phosphoglycolate phosphatase
MRCCARWKTPAAAWGIVTNKPEYLARQTMPMLGWETRCAILIGGDTLPNASRIRCRCCTQPQVMGVTASDCVYVGDDERDIIAARAAEMRSRRRAVGLSPCTKTIRWRGRATCSSNRRTCCATRTPGRSADSACAIPPSTP